MKFGVLYCDPPWSYSDLGHSRRVDRIYPLMKLEALCAMRPQIDRWAEKDCVLFLWCTSPMLMREGHDLLDAWGFVYKSCCVWDKEIFGMGHYWRVQTEYCLLAIRGKPGVAAVRNLPSIIRARRREHSRKPERMYEMIEAMYPDKRKLELFARRPREGWTVWGNEACGED